MTLFPFLFLFSKSFTIAKDKLAVWFREQIWMIPSDFTTKILPGRVTVPVDYGLVMNTKKGFGAMRQDLGKVYEAQSNVFAMGPVLSIIVDRQSICGIDSNSIYYCIEYCPTSLFDTSKGLSKLKLPCYWCKKLENETGEGGIILIRKKGNEELPFRTGWHSTCLLEFLKGEEVKYRKQEIEWRREKRRIARQHEKLRRKWARIILSAFYKEDYTYYRDIWGVDIAQDLVPIMKKLQPEVLRGSYCFNTWFPCLKDALFPGLEIGAIVICNRYDDRSAQNRIGFRIKSSTKLQLVDCTHTIINHKTGHVIGDAKLSAIEHFVALKSYVQAISEFSLVTLFNRGIEEAPMDYGFNSEMQSQFFSCLRKLFPRGALEIGRRIVSNLIEKNFEWMQSRWSILNETYPFEEILNDPQFLESFPPEIQQKVNLLKGFPKN